MNWEAIKQIALAQQIARKQVAAQVAPLAKAA